MQRNKSAGQEAHTHRHKTLTNPFGNSFRRGAKGHQLTGAFRPPSINPFTVLLRAVLLSVSKEMSVFPWENSSGQDGGEGLAEAYVSTLPTTLLQSSVVSFEVS